MPEVWTYLCNAPTEHKYVYTWIARTPVGHRLLFSLPLEGCTLITPRQGWLELVYIKKNLILLYIFHSQSSLSLIYSNEVYYGCCGCFRLNKGVVKCAIKRKINNNCLGFLDSKTNDISRSKDIFLETVLIVCVQYWPHWPR